MCEFISWISKGVDVKNSRVLFLTNDDLDTTKGVKLLKPDVIDDLDGHGAIMNYFNYMDGFHEECINFRSQKNFPKEVSEAFKKGKMSLIGINTEPLTKEARNKFEVFQMKCDNDECSKQDKLRADNGDKRNAILDEYNEKIKKYNKKHPGDKTARARYNRKQKSIMEKKLGIRDNTYVGDKHLLRLEKKIKEAKKFSSLIRIKTNRIKTWQ